MLAQNPGIMSFNWKTHTRTSLSLRCSSLSSSVSPRPLRCAVLGAGLSVAWNLLRHGSKDSHLCVDIYDEAGVGGGASGIAGGLLHPYSPKVRLLWQGAECWEESLSLLNIAEQALLKRVKRGKCETSEDDESVIVRRRRILRPAVNLKNMNVMLEGTTMQSSSALEPGQPLCPSSPEKLPPRACRGIIAKLQLCDDVREEYPQHSPSILSDAWVAVHGAQHMDLGLTGDWESRNYLRYVTADEASKALKVLLPKAHSVHPAIEKWDVTGTLGG